MKPRAIVTGASSGIGYEIAKQLAEKGWKVLGVSFDATAENTASGVIPYKANLLNDGVHSEIIRVAREKLGGLDLLVNNAGGSWVGNFEDMPTEDIDRVLGLNLRSLMLMCRESVPLLAESDRGQIINIASQAAHTPMETIAVYCASKAAVVTFSNVLSKELTAKGIRVNVLSPTGTDTNMFKTVGVEVEKAALVSAESMAKMAIMLTELPADIDVAELLTQKSFRP